jgi:hypothetical protein
MKKTKIILFVIQIFLLNFSASQLLGFLIPAHAASLGLSLSPSIVEVNIKPGKTITQAFNFSNQSDHDQTFVARIIPFTPGDSLGNPSLKPNLRPDWLKYFSLSNTDIKLDEPFSLGANQGTQIILTISIPSKAAYSDLYATLLVTSVVKATPGASSTFGAAIGSNLILTVSPQGNSPALIKITDFRPNKDSFLFHYADYYIADNLNPISFIAVAKNLGKYFTKTSGTLKIDQGNTNVATQVLLANNILANSERNLEGSPSGELIFHPTLISMGVYRASLDLRSPNSSSHGELTLLILPLKLGLGLLVSIALFILVIRFVTRKK